MILAAATPSLILVHHGVVLINATASMPRGIWWSTRIGPTDLEGIRAGDVVSLRAPDRAIELGCVLDEQVLIKHVLATGGERVCRSGDAVWGPNVRAPENWGVQ